MQNILSGARRALVLCAHTDDEYGCAGTAIRLAQAGVEVRYIALSRCEESVPAGCALDVLEVECRESAQRMGLLPENVEVWDFKVRHFPRDRQEILEAFVRANRDYKPDLVMLPSRHDMHQDHAVVSQEGFRAFKRSTLLGYEMPQNNAFFSASCFVLMTEEVMEQKVHALDSYASQGFRPYSSGEFIRSLARVRGMQAGGEYAEAFEAIRLIVR